MTQDIALHETRSSIDTRMSVSETSDRDVFGLDRDTHQSEQIETNTKRAGILIGNAVLQLPIWGFAMSYGVFQDYFTSDDTFHGSSGSTGVVGTTFNGVVYLSMPILFSLFTKKWAQRRQIAACYGAILLGISFLCSSFATKVWHLILTQGVLAAAGSALIYSPTTLSLGEWFATSNKALAYGIVLSCKNIVGSVCPFLFRGLLDRYGPATTLRIWAAIVAFSSICAIFMVPTHPSSLIVGPQRPRRVPLHFLHHSTFYIYCMAIMLQSAGYGIPQTFLSTYVSDVAQLSQTTATLTLTLLSVPGIAASTFFGYLSDNKLFSLSAATITAISALSSAVSVLLFWGLSSHNGTALIILFSLTYGFFASGYSATWGGVLKELEREAAQRNEAIDAGMLLGLLNGARGIGYVSGGLASLPLLNAGGAGTSSRFGYSTSYGPLILFTGLSSLFGGWAVCWRWEWRKLLHL